MKTKLLVLIIFFGLFSLTGYSAGISSPLPAKGAAEISTNKKTASHVRIRKTKSKKPLVRGRAPRKSKESRKGRTVNIM